MVSSLSLFLSENRYFILGKDLNREIVAAHQNTFQDHDSLLTLLKSDSLYQLNVPTKVLFHHSRFNLVPGLLFDPKFTATYLYFSGGDTRESEKTFHTSLASNHLQVVGAIDRKFHDFLIAGKPEFSIHHGACSFLSYLLKERINLVSQEIMVLVSDQYSYIAGFSNQELSVFNRFEINDKESLLAYLSGIVHQLKFDRMHAKVRFFGDCGLLDIDQEWGNTYFKNFTITHAQTNQQYHPGLEVLQHSGVFESYWEFS